TTGTSGDGSTGSSTTGTTGTTGSTGTDTTGTTGAGTTGSSTGGGVGATPPPEEEITYCPEPEVKQFDYGAAGLRETTNIHLTAETAPHSVSHTEFYAVRIGDTVDAPEYGRYDKATTIGSAGQTVDTDQDGLIF